MLKILNIDPQTSYSHVQGCAEPFAREVALSFQLRYHMNFISNESPRKARSRDAVRDSINNDCCVKYETYRCKPSCLFGIIFFSHRFCHTFNRNIAVYVTCVLECFSFLSLVVSSIRFIIFPSLFQISHNRY